MAKERLSNLQKWILVNCYHMTVLYDNKKLLPLSGRNASADKYVFFRDDILLSYFNLKSSRKNTFFKVHHFKETKKYYSAQASLSRTLKNLYDKGYIYDWQLNNFELTKTGQEKAKELKVKGWDSSAQPLTINKNQDKTINVEGEINAKFKTQHSFDIPRERERTGNDKTPNGAN